MIRIESFPAATLGPAIARVWQASASKILAIEKSFPLGAGAPVFTVDGTYTARGWTEWTQGFQYGSAILQFDATGDAAFLGLGREMTVRAMATHLTHMGVHDHGFNNVSTYGNLWRLAREGRLAVEPWERHFYELALRVSGAVQARRWTRTADGGGFIYSFNGPHSLFVDTMRTLRALALSHLLRHVAMEERDQPVSLLRRLVEHAAATAKWIVFYGEGRDSYDVRGRAVHEAIFNVNDGHYRCPSSQQGYSPFTTWTRGLAWAMLGYAEQLEFLALVADDDLGPLGGRAAVEAMMEKALEATCDYYIADTPTDGVPYWDTGAPGLAHLGAYRERAADPFNDHEPVDSSAAAIAAQALLRFGRYLAARGEERAGSRYRDAGLVVARTVLAEPYLSTDAKHQGLLLHSIYHRPNGWDHVPEGSKIPRGEACMWGDYHLRELALYLGRIIRGEPYHAFFGPSTSATR